MVNYYNDPNIQAWLAICNIEAEVSFLAKLACNDLELIMELQAITVKIGEIIKTIESSQTYVSLPNATRMLPNICNTKRT